MALVSRKLGAITVIDVIRARYQSNALANISAIVIVLFLVQQWLRNLLVAQNYSRR